MNNLKESPLSSLFPKVDYATWKEEVEKTLKGAPWERKMQTRTPEGILIEPLYDQTSRESAWPGCGSRLRGQSASGYIREKWWIAQELPFGRPEDFNREARRVLARGQNALLLTLDKATRTGRDPDQAECGEVGADGISLSDINSWKLALEEIDPANTPLIIQAGSSGLPNLACLLAMAHSQNHQPEHWKGCLLNDPFFDLSLYGQLPQSWETMRKELAAGGRLAMEFLPNFSWLSASSLPIHHHGGSAVEELAALLAITAEYLRGLEEEGIAPADALAAITWQTGIGGDFFMELAKFRSARILWTKLCQLLESPDKAGSLRLIARTGLINKSELDPHTNLLRLTTEALSAVLGGCQGITVGTFDECYQLPDDFSMRLARNTQLILQEECFLTQVCDPAGGSYYIETLTDELTAKAWAKFQQWEEQGGYLKVLQSGVIHAEIDKIFKQRMDRLEQRRDILVGVNQFPNAKEKLGAGRSEDLTKIREDLIHMMPNVRPALVNINTEHPHSLIEAFQKGATLGQLTTAIRPVQEASTQIPEPLGLRRLAVPYENLRKACQEYAAQHGNPPTVYLANFGPLRQHKARADFSQSFFEAGGFSAIYAPEAHNDEDTVLRALESKAPVIVLCSTDETYPEIVPAAAKAIKAVAPERIVILAGAPGEQEAVYRESGLDSHISIKSNHYQTLCDLLKKLGVLN